MSAFKDYLIAVEHGLGRSIMETEAKEVRSLYMIGWHSTRTAEHLTRKALAMPASKGVTTTCFLCGITSNLTETELDALGWKRYWVYATRKGGEISHDICPVCDQNHESAAWQKIHARERSLDRQAGYQ